MPETLTTAFYAIWFGDDDYEFFDTEGEARDAAVQINRKLHEGYETGAEGPAHPIPGVEIAPLDLRRLLKLLNGGPRCSVRSRQVLGMIEPDGEESFTSDRSKRPKLLRSNFKYRSAQVFFRSPTLLYDD
ncbi:MAG: hypothetical protein BGO16_02360 [Nitrobacter sp. 62-23]|nr:MAG: hypothetical protein BGO16_02360 [Nitrobacter sp. 62-23]